MDSITDLDPQLANMHAFWLGYGQEFSDEGKVAAYRSGVLDAPLNGVLRLAEGGLDDAAIMFERRRMDGVPWMWWVGPDSDSQLASRLLDHGASRITQVPIMAVELEKAARATTQAELTISEITDQDGVREWAECWAPSMGVAADQVSALIRLEALRFARDGHMTRFVGRIGGEAVGSAALLDLHGVAGIYVVTCAEGRRRQGIGSAMTSAALQAGRERGLKFGTLQATEAGKPVYDRMGFSAVAEFQIFAMPPLVADGQ